MFLELIQVLVYLFNHLKTINLDNVVLFYFSLVLVGERLLRANEGKCPHRQYLPSKALFSSRKGINFRMQIWVLIQGLPLTEVAGKLLLHSRLNFLTSCHVYFLYFGFWQYLYFSLIILGIHVL